MAGNVASQKTNKYRRQSVWKRATQNNQQAKFAIDRPEFINWNWRARMDEPKLTGRNRNGQPETWRAVVRSQVKFGSHFILGQNQIASKKYLQLTNLTFSLLDDHMQKQRGGLVGSVAGDGLVYPK